MTIEEALAALGKTEKQVAATLRKAKCSGVRRGCSACPVAVWLSGQLLGECHVLPLRSVLVDGSGDWTDNPIPVQKFIAAFDAGKYPDLCESFPAD